MTTCSRSQLSDSLPAVDCDYHNNELAQRFRAKEERTCALGSSVSSDSCTCAANTVAHVLNDGRKQVSTVRIMLLCASSSA